MTEEMMNKKIEYWKHRLLDLGKRNRMINYRETRRSTLKLIDPDFSELYRRIVTNEASLSFRRPIDRRTEPRVYTMLTLMHELGQDIDVTVGDIGYAVSSQDAFLALRNMRARAMLALEEQGSNILYLSFGFLEWREKAGEDAPLLRSPLLLVPVTLSLASLNAPFVLKRRDEDIVVNPTLAYYFESEYHIKLPSFDESAENASDYMKKAALFAAENGFGISYEVSLGLLSFLKISMYKDMEKNESRIKENAVIRAMAGASMPLEWQTSLPKSEKKECPREVFRVLSADYSQQEAIRASKEDVSFVMQGPPGTGKSQTIANMIAEALASGKKVLFVSEKMAALRVVWRRLEEVGLADFCLPLHSYKANKREILEEIGANLKLKAPNISDSAMQALETLSLEQERLDGYVEELHRVIEPLGKSAYEVYGILTASEGVALLPYTEKAPLAVSSATLFRREALLEAYGEALSSLGGLPRDNPWSGLSPQKADYAFTRDLYRKLMLLITGVSAIDASLETLARFSEKGVTLRDFPAFATSVRAFYAFGPLPAVWRKDDASLKGAIAFAESASETMHAAVRAEEACRAILYPEAFEKDLDALCKERLSLAADLLRIRPHSLAVKGRFEQRRAAVLSSAEELLDKAKELHLAAVAFLKAQGEASALLSLPLSYDESAIEVLEEWLPFLLDSRCFIQGIERDEIPLLRSLVGQCRAVSVALAEGTARVRAFWEDGVFSLKPSEMLDFFVRRSQSGPTRYTNAQYNRYMRLLRPYYKGEDPSDDDVLSMLLAVSKLAEMELHLDAQKKALSVFGSAYCGSASDWTAMEASLSFAEEVFRVRSDISEDLQRILAAKGREETLGKAMVQIYCMKEALAALEKAYFSLVGEPLDKRQDIAVLEGSLSSGIQTLEALCQRSKTLTGYFKETGLCEEALRDGCQLMNEHRRLARLAAQQENSLRATFGRLYKGDLASLDSLVLYLKMQCELGGKMGGDELLEAEKKASYEALDKAERAYEAIKPHLLRLAASFEGTSLLDASARQLHARFGAMLRSFDKIECYRAYAEAKREAVDEGLGEFIDAYEVYYTQNAAEDTDPVVAVYRKSFYVAWADARRRESPELARFDKRTQNERVKRFGVLDERALVTARKRIRASLIKSFPSTDRMLRAGDELTVLEREMQKRRGIMPLRKLFASIPHLLMKLKPCLMMSPLSVSYFLEAKSYHFDLVIFDEASQIFPEDAIGALCRADRAVIVGDSKQLPPTNFFASHASSEEASDAEEYDETLEESILEKASACLPKRTLLWHYRSRHEHLIAFSNREIYKNSLITFPSAEEKTADCGIDYIYEPNGVYEGGGKNHNQVEAATCVRLVEEHILRHPERSLGIIAFSEKQQRTIEDAVEAFREAHREYEFFFADNKDEPFFVKNLENVQGDERDTIFFSIGYAKDRKGRMYMRFGPLGMEGGERRLNVAITRAKRNIKLIGSILPGDIDLSRTSSEGVRMLRAYIEFAISGESALPQKKAHFDSEEDLFADTVAQFLTDHGYTVKRRVGCSDYKVEIAVMHPLHKEAILAGVECDGRFYAHSGSARDRDHLVSQVLTQMGWRLTRVWSSAWVADRAREEKALLDFLEACRCEEKEIEAIMPLAGEGEALQENNARPVFEEEPFSEEAAEGAETTAERDEAPSERQEENNGRFAFYREADWSKAPHSAARDRETVTAERIFYLVKEEAPLHKELLYRRMAPAFKSGKITEGLRRVIDGVLEGVLSSVVLCDERGFLTLKTTAVKARLPLPGATPRPMEYIAREEVADAILTLLSVTVGITVEDLFSETARLFGFERIGQKIKAKLDEALFFLMMTEKIALFEGKVELR